MKTTILSLSISVCIAVGAQTNNYRSGGQQAPSIPTGVSNTGRFIISTNTATAALNMRVVRGQLYDTERSKLWQKFRGTVRAKSNGILTFETFEEFDTPPVVDGVPLEEGFVRARGSSVSSTSPGKAKIIRREYGKTIAVTNAPSYEALARRNDLGMSLIRVGAIMFESRELELWDWGTLYKYSVIATNWVADEPKPLASGSDLPVVITMRHIPREFAYQGTNVSVRLYPSELMVDKNRGVDSIQMLLDHELTGDFLVSMVAQFASPGELGVGGFGGGTPVPHYGLRSTDGLKECCFNLSTYHPEGKRYEIEIRRKDGEVSAKLDGRLAQGSNTYLPNAGYVSFDMNDLSRVRLHYVRIESPPGQLVLEFGDKNVAVSKPDENVRRR